MIDDINAEIDKRKVNELVDEGVLSLEDLANAPIILVEPSCKCGNGLDDTTAQLKCPVCGALGVETEQEQ